MFIAWSFESNNPVSYYCIQVLFWQCLCPRLFKGHNNHRLRKMMMRTWDWNCLQMPLDGSNLLSGFGEERTCLTPFLQSCFRWATLASINCWESISESKSLPHVRHTATSVLCRKLQYWHNTEVTVLGEIVKHSNTWDYHFGQRFICLPCKSQLRRVFCGSKVGVNSASRYLEAGFHNAFSCSQRAWIWMSNLVLNLLV